MNQQKEIHNAINHLKNWADSDAWRDEQEEVFEEHFMDLAERLDFPFEEFMDLLIEYDLLASAMAMFFEDFATRRFGPDGRNLIEDFLQRRGWREGVRGRRYLRQLLESDLSLYEVTKVVPGEYCVVSDLMKKRNPIRVYEKTGTHMMAKWDRLGARILPGDGKCMFASAVLPFSAEVSDRVLRVLNKVQKDISKTLNKLEIDTADKKSLQVKLDDMKAYAPRVFTSMWIMDALERIDRPMPEIVTRDGDPLIFATTRLTFKAADREQVISLLDTAPEWNREPGDKFDWVWLVGESADDSDSRMINGFLNLKGDRLKLTVNSTRRSEQALELLNQLLGDLVTASFTEIQSPQQMMSSGEYDDAELPPSGLDESDIEPEQLAEIMNRHLDEHYRKTLDEPVPMLGNKSPRACVKSAAGKKKVIAWLKYLENQDARMASKPGSVAYDFAWMWKELGLGAKGEVD